MLYPPEQINVELLREARHQRSRNDAINAQYLHEMDKNKHSNPLRLLSHKIAALIAALLISRG